MPSELETLQYVCKFCHQPGEAKFDPAASGLFRLDFWKFRLCCNRCADYECRRRVIEDKIFATVRMFARSRKDQDRIEIAWQVLVKLTKEYAGLVCDYYRKTTVWEPDFVQLLMDKPHSVEAALKGYRHGTKRV